MDVLHVDADRPGADDSDPPVSQAERVVGSGAVRSAVASGVDCVVVGDRPGASVAEILDAVRAVDDTVPVVYYAADADEAAVRDLYEDEHTTFVARDAPASDRTLARRVEELTARRSDRPFDPVFEGPDDAVVLLDADGRIVRMNQTAVEMASVSETGLLGAPLWELPWWDTDELPRETVRQAVERALDGEYAQYQSVNHQSVDQRGTEEVLAFDTRFRPVRDERGDVAGVLVDARDVTERYRLERQLREERDLNRRILETSPVGIAIINGEGDVEYMNERGHDLLGGIEHASEVTVLDREGEPMGDRDRVFRQVIERDEPVLGVEVGVVEDEDEEQVRWFSVNGTPLQEDRAVLTFEDVTSQRQRGSLLADLAKGMQSLPDAETRRGVASAAAETVRAVLDFDAVGIALYSDDGSLSLVGESDDRFETAIARSPEESLPWRAFIEGEPMQEEGLLAYPVGTAAVVLVRSADGYDSMEVQSLSLLAANLQSALARADREADLREQRSTLEARTAELERVEQTNRIIRELTGELIRATSRDEVEAAVCESFVADGPYRLAWLGQYSPATGRLEPVARAGEGVDYVDAIDVTVDEEPTGQGPAGRAFRTQEVQVQNDLYRDEEFDPWRREALRRGFRASVAVPLTHRNSMYGILCLYAEKPNVFGDLERAVLDELGQTIGYAINALERKRALAADRSVELELKADATDLQLFPFLAGTDADLTIEDVVLRSDGGAHLFFRLDGIEHDDVLDTFGSNSQIEDVALLDRETNRYQALLSSSSIPVQLLDRGFSFESAEYADGTMHITLRIPPTADPHEPMGLLREAIGSVQLVSKREVRDPVQSRQEFEDAYFEELTDRQEEVLRTAYSAGFFEWPRVSSGQDIADMLGVSQPTINRHLRAAERKLYSQLLDRD